MTQATGGCQGDAAGGGASSEAEGGKPAAQSPCEPVAAPLHAQAGAQESREHTSTKNPAHVCPQQPDGGYSTSALQWMNGRIHAPTTKGSRPSAASRGEAPAPATPRTDPEHTTVREGTGHERPHGVRVRLRETSGTGSSTDGEGARGSQGGDGGVTGDGDEASSVGGMEISVRRQRGESGTPVDVLKTPEPDALNG